MSKAKGMLEVKKGLENASDKQIKARLRKYAIASIERMVELANSPNDSVALGANKFILERFAPALKAMEISGKDGERLEGLIVIRTNDDNSKPMAN